MRPIRSGEYLPGRRLGLLVTYDPGRFLRAVLYGVPHRALQVAQWEAALWGPQLGPPIIQGLGAVDSRLRQGLSIPGPTPTAPLPSAGQGTPPPPPPPPTGPEWVKPASNWGILSCPNGYTLTRVGPLEIPAYSCKLAGTNPLPVWPTTDLWAYGLP